MSTFFSNKNIAILHLINCINSNIIFALVSYILICFVGNTLKKFTMMSETFVKKCKN